MIFKGPFNSNYAMILHFDSSLNLWKSCCLFIHTSSVHLIKNDDVVLVPFVSPDDHTAQ